MCSKKRKLYLTLYDAAQTAATILSSTANSFRKAKL